MKHAILVGLAIAGLAGAAVAGSPETPGRNGAVVNSAKEYWQGDKGYDHPNGWGQEVKAETQGYGPLGAGKLGDFLKNGPLTGDGRPNPANDNGSGND